MHCLCAACQQYVVEYYTCGQQPLVAVVPEVPLPQMALAAASPPVTLAPLPWEPDAEKPLELDTTEDVPSNKNEPPPANQMSDAASFHHAATNTTKTTSVSPHVAISSIDHGRQNSVSTSTRPQTAFSDPTVGTKHGEENEAKIRAADTARHLAALKREADALHSSRQRIKETMNEPETGRHMDEDVPTTERKLEINPAIPKLNKMELTEAMDMRKQAEDEAAEFLRRQELDALECTRRMFQIEASKRRREHELANMEWKRKAAEFAADQAARRREELEDALELYRAPYYQPNLETSPYDDSKRSDTPTPANNWDTLEEAESLICSCTCYQRTPDALSLPDHISPLGNADNSIQTTDAYDTTKDSAESDQTLSTQTLATSARSISSDASKSPSSKNSTKTLASKKSSKHSVQFRKSRASVTSQKKRSTPKPVDSLSKSQRKRESSNKKGHVGKRRRSVLGCPIQ